MNQTPPSEGLMDDSNDGTTTTMPKASESDPFIIPTLIPSGISVDIMEKIKIQNGQNAIVNFFRMLQAKWGVANTAQSESDNSRVDAIDNKLYAFKTIGYNRLPGHRSDEGLVCLLVNKNIKEVRNATPTFTELLHEQVIKSPNISIFLDSMNDLGKDQTQLIVYVIEKNLSGRDRRWESQELKSAFETPQCRTALSDLGVIDLAEVIEPDKRQLEQYLANPPPGIDAETWELAKSDNPDPSRLIPVEFFGFESLDRRIEFQSEYQEQQRARLEIMMDEVVELEKRYHLAQARLEPLSVNQRRIAHRVLQVMEIFQRCRLSGTEKKPFEKAFENTMASLLQEVDDLSKGKLQEVQKMVNQLSKQNEIDLDGATELTEENLSHFRELFEEHQKGFSALVDILNDDLRLIEEVRQESLRSG